MKSLGLYIHTPFCLSKCPYCDFYSGKFSDVDKKRYTDAVLSEIPKWGKKSKERVIDTLYFGGGTPTLLEDNIVTILKSVKENFKCDFKEITIDANPYKLSYDLLKKYAENGINRLSLGIQSANDDELKKLGRLHRRSDIAKSVEIARKAGFKNISLDLMIGISAQTEESLDDTLNFYNNLDVEHISGYILKIEEGTPYFKLKDKFDFPNDDETVNLYFKMVDKLSEFGFNQYEISNFAKSGFESKHNLKYWNCKEYIGIGPSAYGFFEGDRYHYPSDIKEFIENPQIIFDEKGGDEFERIMLKLRLSEGINLNDYSCKDKILKNLKKIPDDYFILDDNQLKLTKNGFALSNSIISTLTEDF